MPTRCAVRSAGTPGTRSHRSTRPTGAPTQATPSSTRKGRPSSPIVPPPRPDACRKRGVDVWTRRRPRGFHVAGRTWDGVVPLAEADGNRTRLTEVLGHVGFEDRGGHQLPERLPGGEPSMTWRGRHRRRPVWLRA